MYYGIFLAAEHVRVLIGRACVSCFGVEGVVFGVWAPKPFWFEAYSSVVILYYCMYIYSVLRYVYSVYASLGCGMGLSK